VTSLGPGIGSGRAKKEPLDPATAVQRNGCALRGPCGPGLGELAAGAVAAYLLAMAPTTIEEVNVSPIPLDKFAPYVGDNAVATVRKAGQALRERLAGHVVWNVNSTARGGGVAELLRSLLAYARSVGIDTRWLVIGGNPDFFRVTKRLHNALHGEPGDGTPLDDAAHDIYDQTTRENLPEVLALVKPGDVVILHDPQTAGLIGPLAAHGAKVIWRCHIGHDTDHPQVMTGWQFLDRYFEGASRFVFSRKTYIPDKLNHHRSRIIPPSIDPLSAKNQPMAEDVVRSILTHTGLVAQPSSDVVPSFVREDGSPGRVDRAADVMRLGPAPSFDVPLVIQVSRWDRLKDHGGVMRGFAAMVDAFPTTEAELLLVGPNVHAVADDPEGAEVFAEIVDEWRALPRGTRQRVHLVNLPMADIEENAAIVNALQRHAAVIVQKSLREGFGLTVTEAMWKARPVLASAVGGIQDQIVAGESGVLLEDPTDLDAFARQLGAVLTDPALAARLGEGARERVRDRFLGVHSLLNYAALIDDLL